MFGPLHRAISVSIRELFFGHRGKLLERRCDVHAAGGKTRFSSYLGKSDIPGTDVLADVAAVDPLIAAR
ncbi:MAG: hypothetical protein ACE5H0_14895, partial [Bacteroidota bacterium]